MNKKRFYVGSSMKRTFLVGDRLLVESVPFKDIRPGDVVVYRRASRRGQEDELVHRVVGTAPEGLVARGDGNFLADKTHVTENNLVGKVAYVIRAGDMRHVSGGLLGLLHARLLLKYRSIRLDFWRVICRIGRKSYSRLRENGLIKYLWKPSLLKLALITENGLQIKYVCGKRTVACYWVDTGRVKLRKPYDLVLWHEMLGKMKKTNVKWLLPDPIFSRKMYAMPI